MLCPWRKRLWVPEEPSLMDRNTICNAFQCSSQRAALSFQWKLSHMVILHEEPRVKANRLLMKELKHLRINSDKGGFPWLVFSENLEVFGWLFSVAPHLSFHVTQLLCLPLLSYFCHQIWGFFFPTLTNTLTSAGGPTIHFWLCLPGVHVDLTG